MTPETTLTITIGAAATVVVGLIAATWRLANYVRDAKEEIKGLRLLASDAWTRRQQERWALDLEKRNLRLPLDVPNPRHVEP